MDPRFKGKILVMGVGYVGSAVFVWFKEQGLEPLAFDPPKGLGTPEDLARAEIVFLCVPTPYDDARGGFDLSFVESAIAALPGGKTVVIKSTVLPGTTDEMRAKHPQHVFMFNPEFLRQVSAHRDFIEPDRQIVGARAEDRTAAEEIMALLPDAPVKKIMASKEAEMVKYFGNCFLATKVVFANQLYDLCAATGISYDAVMEGAGADPRIGTGHLQVMHEGYRGYSGSCFPKDMRALIQLGDRVGAPLELLKTVERLNNETLAKNPPRAAVQGTQVQRDLAVAEDQSSAQDTAIAQEKARASVS
ncbi:MAG: UDP-glucose 6-dehydrogenase [Candidatus Parcubacteria bacterium]|jgi:UDPglucose 6-dehydrogenase